MNLRIINLAAILQNVLLARKNRGNKSPYHFFSAKQARPNKVRMRNPPENARLSETKKPKVHCKIPVLPPLIT